MAHYYYAFILGFLLQHICLPNYGNQRSLLLIYQPVTDSKQIVQMGWKNVDNMGNKKLKWAGETK